MGKCQLPRTGSLLTSVFIPSLPCQTASLCCRGPTRPLTQGLASEFLGHRLGFYVDPGASGLAGKCSAARGLWFALVGGFPTLCLSSPLAESIGGLDPARVLGPLFYHLQSGKL